MSNELLIVGGTGFLGKHLAAASIGKGYKVTILSLNKPDQLEKLDKANYLAADLRSFQQVNSQLSGMRFNYVVNLGGYVDHGEYLKGGKEAIDAHFSGVQNLLQSLDWDALKCFVQIGSSDEYGDHCAPQSEDLREKPISSYAAAKVAACQLLQMLHRVEGFPSVILRLFLVYGEEQNPQRFIPQIIKGCLGDERFPASKGEQLRDFCHVRDVVEGILMALKTPAAIGEVINIASGKPVKIKDVLEIIRTTIGKGKAIYGEIEYRPNENMQLYADISKAMKILSWQPKMNLREGLNQVIEHYKKKMLT